MKKVFIDGESGTTGLQIREKIQGRDDIHLVLISDQDRKNLKKKVELAKSVDCIILCLPDDAAKEMAKALKDTPVKIIDASTAHRTDPTWVYGFPELNGHREKIKIATHISNPGCYSTGFIALVKPIIEKNLLPPDFPFTTQAVSGYSGGGKSLIKTYKKKDYFYMPYALELKHKHLPEMKHISGLEHEPVFVPAVDPFLQGMLVQVPLHAHVLKQHQLTLEKLVTLYQDYFKNEPFIQVKKWVDTELTEGKFLPVNVQTNHNLLEIILLGSEDGHVVLTARLDNLGKGASGAAIQNMNLALGLNESLSLLPQSS